MGALPVPDPQFAWWRAALTGNRGDFDTRNPPSGYYRQHDRSLAIWRDDDGTLRWTVSHGFPPRHIDQLCDAFASFGMRPVSYEDWLAHSETGLWPESPEPEIAAARVGIGHNSGSPAEVIADELAAIETAFREWLASIGGVIATEAHDAKAEEFKRRFGDLKKRADDAHEAEKRPHLEAGREVDRLWKAPRERAEAGKREVGAALTPYRRERERIRAEAERKARAALAEAGQPAPIEQHRPKPRSGLRSVKTLVLTDAKAAGAFIASLHEPPADFLDVVRVVARRMIEAGVAVPGAEIRTEKVA